MKKPTIKLKKHHLLAIASVTLFAAIALWFLVLLQYKINQVYAEGLNLVLPNDTVIIPAADINFTNNAFRLVVQRITNKPFYNLGFLQEKITESTSGIQGTVKNPGVTINDGSASLDTQSAPGLVLDQNIADATVVSSLNHLQNHITLQMVQQQPTVSMAAAEKATVVAQKILGAPITAIINNTKISIKPSEIGGWIVQTPKDGNDDISFDANAIAASVQQIVAPYSQPEQDLDFDMDSNGQVENFTAPKDGIGVDSAQAVKDITAILQSRTDGQGTDTESSSVTLTLQTVHGGVSDQAKSLGIEDLLGSATTPFTGSTKNRIHNITVGASKLNGTIVQAGQEFSTIKTLGDIGPETGYVEELVILGPNTVPAYGGGLCQVSTTLFRAILNAAMPITARQNHSYRVSFYEKDGDGKSIGPGLDATIYDPSPDLKFMNDSGHPILITDQIVGTKITFSLYGTPDGRTSAIIGPTIIRTLPAPPAETVYSATLPPGEVKQTEFSHTGADTTASYEIHYTNGQTKTQTFDSHYHGLPAIYITNDPTVAPAATAAPSTTTPTATTTPVIPAD